MSRMTVRRNFMRTACMLTIPIAVGLVGFHFGRTTERLQKPPYISVSEFSAISPERSSSIILENIGKIEKETKAKFPVQSGEVPTGVLSVSIQDNHTLAIRFYHLGSTPDLLNNRSMEIADFIDSRIQHYTALKESDENRMPEEEPKPPIPPPNLPIRISPEDRSPR